MLPPRSPRAGVAAEGCSEELVRKVIRPRGWASGDGPQGMGLGGWASGDGPQGMGLRGWASGDGSKGMGLRGWASGLCRFGRCDW
jgi:hypothetical protein